MRRRGARTVRTGATAVAIALATAGFAETGASAAQQVALTLTYTCTFPAIGDQSVPVDVDADIPSSIPVGRSTAHFLVRASATAPWELTVGLRAFGVASITGTVDGQTEIQAPQGVFTETVPFVVAPITLPAYSSFTATATGSAPAMTFTKPGTVKIIVGSLTMHLDPTDANGNLTSLGAFDVPCTLNAGQSDVAATSVVTAAAPPAGSRSTTAAPSDPGSAAAGASASGPSASARVNTGTSTGVSAAAQSDPASPADPGSSAQALRSSEDPGSARGGGGAWPIWLGALAAIAVVGAAAVRYGPRLRRR
jgi:hypothetical protein